MMLANDELRVVLVTIHVSLRQAIDQLGVERIATTITLAHRSRAACRPGHAAHRGGRVESACRRGRPVRRRRGALHRAGDRARARRRHRRQRALRARHRVHAGTPRAGAPGRVRLRGRDDARPRPDPGEVPGRRARRQRDAGAAVRAHQPRSRHRVRHRGPRRWPIRAACWPRSQWRTSCAGVSFAEAAGGALPPTRNCDS